MVSDSELLNSFFTLNSPFLIQIIFALFKIISHLHYTELMSYFFKTFFLPFILLQFSVTFSGAQTNFVLNPSFETYTSCPSTGGDINKLQNWDTCRGTADFFNLCATSSAFGVPKNLFGSQFPANGSTHCGLYTYNTGGLYREIIVGQLSTPLNVSTKYYISLKLNKADSNGIVGYSTNKMGVKFSKVKQKYTAINNSAHFYSNSIISDTVNWTVLFGTFIADSAYNYLMIGNFFDDTNTFKVNDGTGSMAYYYIDDVCVSSDSLYTFNYSTSIEDDETYYKIKLSPNPATLSFRLENFLGEFVVYNSIGVPVFQGFRCDRIDCSSWTNDIYFIRANGRVYKLVINH
jgi:hypothetical protein